MRKFQFILFLVIVVLSCSKEEGEGGNSVLGGIGGGGGKDGEVGPGSEDVVPGGFVLPVGEGM